MKDIKIKMEQILQSLEQYQSLLSKDGDLSVAENKKLAAILKRVTDKAMLADGFFNNEDITKLIESYSAILTKYNALSITKMKSLEPSVLANLGKLKKVLIEIDDWIIKANALDNKFKGAVKNHVDELKELKVEGALVVKVVDGNQLNPTSQKEFAKVLGTSDGSKATLDNSIEKLLAIPEEDRSAKQIETLQELETRKDTIESFEKDLLTLVDKNKVRMDRVDSIKDVNGNPSTANGQAIYDPVTKELVLELDATGGASLGAHELLHLVQAKKGKLVFFKNGLPLGIFIDLQDEVDAYKIQFAINPGSVPGSAKKITDITPAFVKALDTSLYGNLPDDQHDMNSTMTKLNDHPAHKGFVKSNMLRGEFTKGGVKTTVWDHYKNWKFIDFINDILFDPKGVKTNAEMDGYVIIK